MKSAFSLVSLIVVSLLLSHSAFAERSVTDLVGLPDQGEFWLEVDVDFANAEFDVVVNGSRLSNTEVESASLSSDLIWGFSDSLSFGLKLDYLLSSKTTTTLNPDTTPSTSETKDSGIVDPTLRLAWRVIEGGSDSFNLDLQTFFAPKLFTAEDGTATKDGNGARGNTLLGAGFDMSWLREANQFAITLGVVQNFAGEEQEADDATDITTDKSRTDIVAVLGYRRQLNDSIAVSVNQSLSISGKNVSTDSSGDVTTIESALALGTFVGLEYHVVPKSHTIEFEIGYQTQAETDADVNGTALTIQNFKQISYGVGYLAEF